MNSSNNSAAPCRLYSVRLARLVWRLVWNRRSAWTLVCLVSLTTLYYQWENRRSARELASAHARLVERIGTSSALAFAPPVIPDGQNYFALPVVEQWATGPLSKGSRFKRYVIPNDAFLPPRLALPKLIENDDGTSHLDFAAWAADRDLKGELPAVALNRELGDGNGLLPPLAAGLGRPFSCLKPAQQEVLSVEESPFEPAIPDIQHTQAQMLALGMHLRCAAAAGDAKKTRDVALIMLRLFPEAAATHHGMAISAMVSLSTHRLAFTALQDALGKPGWNEAALHDLQMQLGKIDDIETMERALQMQMLVTFGTGLHWRERARRGDLPRWDWFGGHSGNRPASRLFQLAATSMALYGPDGWHDSNLAFLLECQLHILGPHEETAWLEGSRRSREVKQRLTVDDPHLSWSPRRCVAAAAVPDLGDIYGAAAHILFHRRCLIIACALEKHRLRHGAYPATLDAVAGELKPFPVADPARPAVLPGYRQEGAGGYLLWSAGPDARDDGGTQDNDWLWRMRRGGS